MKKEKLGLSGILLASLIVFSGCKSKEQNTERSVIIRVEPAPAYDDSLQMWKNFRISADSPRIGEDEEGSTECYNNGSRTNLYSKKAGYQFGLGNLTESKKYAIMAIDEAVKENRPRAACALKVILSDIEKELGQTKTL